MLSILFIITVYSSKSFGATFADSLKAKIFTIESTATPEEALRVSIQQFDEYTRVMDIENMVQMFTEDGQVRNGTTNAVTGRPAIKEFLGAFDKVIQVQDQQTEIKDITIKGDTAIVNGIFHQKALLLSNKQQIENSGEVVEFWIRQADKTWRLRKMGTK
jgi:uncharacterized protein (TIGR02246 family)